MNIFYIILIIVLIILVVLFVMYNNFIKLNNKVKEAFATMDVYLKKRWDLIPNLVEIVKGYAKFEKETLTDIINLRSGNYDTLNDNEKINTNEKITESIRKIMILSENYPELKASANFQDLSHNLSKVEEDIANARKYYNGVVRIYNTKIEIFPNNILAKIFGFKSRNMFQAEDREKESIKVEL